MSAVAPLRSPAFRRYLAGQLPSVTCSWAQVVALSWIVVERYPAAIGLVVAAQYAPSVILGPWFGALADRHERKRILIVCELGLGLVAAAYAIAEVADLLTLPLIYALATAWGIINALDTPARQAIVPSLVEREHAASASGLVGVLLLVGMTAGSALGAVLVAVAGPATAFAVNAASFFGDAVLIGTIRVGKASRAVRAPGQMREGFAYVWRTARLRTPLLALAVLATFAFTVQVSVPILLSQSYGGGPLWVGAGYTAVTAGGLAGAGVAAMRGAPGPRRLSGAAVAMAATMAVCAAAPTIPVALCALVGVGFAWSLFVASTVATLQTAEASRLGRVMSWLAVVLVGGMAAGGPIAGLVAEWAGPRAPFVVGAGASLSAVAILGWRRTTSRIGQRWATAWASNEITSSSVVCEKLR